MLPESHEALERAHEAPFQPGLHPISHRAPLARLGSAVATCSVAHGERAEPGGEKRDGEPDRARAEVTTRRDAARHDADNRPTRQATKAADTDDDEAADPSRIERASDLAITKPVANDAEALADGPCGGLAAGAPPWPHPADRRNFRSPFLDVDVRMHDT